MALNVDKLTLSEYRLTQNPSWQDVLANAIAEQIFEDGRFSPEEVTAAKEFMRNLGEDKRQHLRRTIRHWEIASFKKDDFFFWDGFFFPGVYVELKDL